MNNWLMLMLMFIFIGYYIKSKIETNKIKKELELKEEDFKIAFYKLSESDLEFLEKMIVNDYLYMKSYMKDLDILESLYNNTYKYNKISHNGLETFKVRIPKEFILKSLIGYSAHATKTIRKEKLNKLKNYF